MSRLYRAPRDFRVASWERTNAGGLETFLARYCLALDLDSMTPLSRSPLCRRPVERERLVRPGGQDATTVGNRVPSQATRSPSNTTRNTSGLLISFHCAKPNPGSIVPKYSASALPCDAAAIVSP